VLWEISLKNR